MNDLTLLYVEDEIQTIQSIDFFLKRLFKEVFIAQDGEEALSLFSERKPDVVILDISIPKIDGLKVASKIRKDYLKMSDIWFLYQPTAYSAS